MKVSGNGIRNEALLKRGHGDIPVETACSKTHIEDDTLLAARYHRGIHLAGRKQFFAMAGITMRVDVTGSQLVEQERVDIPLLVEISEIDHDRKTGKVPGLNRILHR